MKKYIIGGIAVLALILSIVGLVGGNQSVQTIVKEVPAAKGTTNYDELQLGLATGRLSTGSYLGGTIAAGSNQDCQINNTGATLYASNAIMGMTGTASSSYRVALFATSSASIISTHDYTAIIATTSTLISNTVWATSTVATTTNSLIRPGNGVVAVNNGSYMCAYIQQVDVGCAGAATGMCEAATSTARGFSTVIWKAPYIR